MKIRPHIAIIGGGPSGLIAAIILHKHGFPVHVFEQERSRDHRAQGGSLDLHTDGGQTALQHAGVLDEFRAIARHEDQETRNVDPWSGAPLKPFHEEGDTDRPEIDRGELRNLLLGALPESAVKWNRRLTQVDGTEDGRWRLLFEEGADAVADIVIGADGAWSQVRSALSPSVPEYSGVTFLEGWIHEPSTAQAGFVGHGTMFSFGEPEAVFAQRNGHGRICVYAAIKRSRDWISLKAERQSMRDLVLSMFDGWAPQLRDLLNGCEEYVERPIYQLPLGFEWQPQKGLYLVGDAAHLMPPVGVGVNLAMLDASDLAMAIAETENWERAAQNAQIDICRRAAEIMQQAIPGFQQWFQPGPG
ncbi:MAG: monooxygenase [Rhizobiales bacterium]|nr:monooxygenase [Hyphomicrobiales bacterium]MBA70214.1 monooxygenase [Hyphomicrobiales bacterium]|tara:strand:- start:1052 stop:2131 length:1080 start_codon:yes stop_codon:yes gene_type:complete